MIKENQLKSLIIDFEEDHLSGPSSESKERFRFRFLQKKQLMRYYQNKKFSGVEKVVFKDKLGKVDKFYEEVFVPNWSKIRNKRLSLVWIFRILVTILALFLLSFASLKIKCLFCLYILTSVLMPPLGLPFFVINELIESVVKKYVYKRI